MQKLLQSGGATASIQPYLEQHIPLVQQGRSGSRRCTVPSRGGPHRLCQQGRQPLQGTQRSSCGASPAAPLLTRQEKAPFCKNKAVRTLRQVQEPLLRTTAAEQTC